MTLTVLSNEKTNIQTYYARYAGLFADFLKNRHGNRQTLEELNRLNITIGDILDIIDRKILVATNYDEEFHLTDTEAISLINFCYRKLNNFRNNIFNPADPNIYMD